MNNIFEKMDTEFKVFKTTGASIEMITEAERKLGRKFSSDFKEYLSIYGAVSFGSTELTGLNIDSYANIVNVTLKEIERNSLFPQDSVVLENLGVEGLLILINDKGIVYEWQNGKVYSKYASLKEYISSKLSKRK